jgi:hypothetical protein
MRSSFAVGCLFTAFLAVLVQGCASDYSWRTTVPDDMRTVAVPTFRNESEVQELGPLMSGQLAREFQREGTFKLRREGDAALEIQGVVKSAGSGIATYDRRSGMRVTSHEMVAKVVVSVIDKRNGKVLVDNRPYSATASFAAIQDISTAQRDASGRVAEDLAAQVVDDVLNLKW